jgi:hypothetical protein
MTYVKGAFLTLLSILFLAAAAQPGVAASINLSTGQNGSGIVQGSGDLTDAHWSVTGATSEVGTNSAKTVFPVNADFGINPPGGACSVGTNWICNDGSSDWIAFNPDTSQNGSATYSTTFDLSGFNLSTVALSGFWTLDDQGSLSLNGNLIASLSSASDPWTSLHAFSVPNGFFHSGSNTLTIALTADNFLDGVRLNGVVTGTAVPEPASLTLMGLGLAGFVARRRSARKS